MNIYRAQTQPVQCTNSRSLSHSAYSYPKNKSLHISVC